jgi:hypothetical protein
LNLAGAVNVARVCDSLATSPAVARMLRCEFATGLLAEIVRFFEIQASGEIVQPCSRRLAQARGAATLTLAPLRSRLRPSLRCRAGLAPLRSK